MTELAFSGTVDGAWLGRRQVPSKAGVIIQKQAKDKCIVTIVNGFVSLASATLYTSMGRRGLFIYLL